MRQAPHQIAMAFVVNEISDGHADQRVVIDAKRPARLVAVWGGSVTLRYHYRSI
jgi:hypothetical protein